MGAYHTIELELNRKFTLAKKIWDSVVLDRIGECVLVTWEVMVLLKGLNPCFVVLYEICQSKSLNFKVFHSLSLSYGSLRPVLF